MTDELSNSNPFRIDEKSFRQIYMTYWDKVFAICYNNLGKPEVAKEMVQDIFKSLWEGREELEITNYVELYLLRSAQSKVFEYLRNIKSRKEQKNYDYCRRF